jgi:hypothetical protein
MPTIEPTIEKAQHAAERDLAKSMRHMTKAAADLAQAVDDRDDHIRAALAVKVPYARIATATRLSTQRIEQIRRHART